MSGMKTYRGNPKRMYHFAYGANLDPELMRERCGLAQVVAVARLADHRLAFCGRSVTWDGGLETVVPEPGAEVWGVVYELTHGQGETLDGCQDARLDGTGACFHYPVSVTDADGTAYPVLLYKRAEVRDCRPPSTEYLDFIIRGGKARSLPDAYLAALAAVESRPASYHVPRPDKVLREISFGSSCDGCGG